MFREKIFYFCGSTLGKLEFGFEIWDLTENCSGPSPASGLGQGPGIKRNMESVRDENITYKLFGWYRIGQHKLIGLFLFVAKH